MLVVVFFTGAAVLIIEIVAARILAPHFGNTIFTYTSIITVILTGLSFGYFYGGRMADRYPATSLFYGIIFVSGFLVLCIELFILFFLNALTEIFSLIWGPLVSSVVLFLVPSFLLGMLSPYGIKLQSVLYPEKGVGNISGEVFFYSTVGSIAGSLVTGFYLIPFFGVDTIIIGVGAGLLSLGLSGLYGNVLPKKVWYTFVVISFAAVAIVYLFTSAQYDKRLVYAGEGWYERLFIYDVPFNDRPARILQSEFVLSSAVYLDSDELVFDYTKYYTFYRVFGIEPENVLVLGAGAFSVPKAYLEALPDAEVDVVEIEPRLYELSKKYFRLQDNPRLHSFTEDARRFLRDSKKQYDIIFGDIYLSLSIPSHAITVEYFSLLSEKLNDDGVYIMNVIGDLYDGKDSLTHAVMATFRQVFPNYYFFAVESPESKEIQNFIFVGTKSEQKLDFEGVVLTESDDVILKNLKNHLVDVSQVDFSRYTVFYDRYAPAELLTASMLRRNAGG